MQRRSTDYVTAVLSTDCPVLHQSVSKQFNMSSNFLSTRPQFQFSRTAAMAKSRPGLPLTEASIPLNTARMVAVQQLAICI